MNDNVFHLKANGKLLLTGEYLVLDGAAALALPLVFNQTMEVIPSEDGLIKWYASDVNEEWFSCEFTVPDFEIRNALNAKMAVRLQSLLRCANSLKPLMPPDGAVIKTHLNYNRFMGLGSSSTLISLIADLFAVDKFKLHSIISSGSGFDIAAAGFDHPIIYQRLSRNHVRIKPINFLPSFCDNIYFVWLGKKQNTDNEIRFYRKNKTSDIKSSIEKISNVTFNIPEVKELSNFASLIEKNEEIIAFILKRKTLKQSNFSDFDGTVKSLGAWGGDFMLAISEHGLMYVTDYFKSKGCDTIYRFKDIALNKKVINNDDIDIRF